MAELYVGTPNGVQKLGNECTYPIPKGKVVLTNARNPNSATDTSYYHSNELIGKSLIDVTISYTDGYDVHDKTLRCFANDSIGYNNDNTKIAVYFASSSGDVKIIAYTGVGGTTYYAYIGKVTAYYYE